MAVARLLPCAGRVECRIDVVYGRERRTVRLAGRLAAAHVPAFLQACDTSAGALDLDLIDLIAADAVGVDALLQVRDRGADLINVPEYIQLKLESLAQERRSTAPPKSDSRGRP